MDIKVGDRVKFIDIPIGSEYIMVNLWGERIFGGSRLRTSTGGLSMATNEETPESHHTTTDDYAIQRLPEGLIVE